MRYQQADFDALQRLLDVAPPTPVLPGAVPAPPAALSRQQLAGPDADRLLWGHVAERSTAVQDLLTAAAHVPAFPDLMTDLFNTFFKSAPRLRAAAEVDPAVAANRPRLAPLLDDPTTATTRRVTQRDDLAAALAALAAGRAIWAALQDTPPDAEDGSGGDGTAPDPRAAALAAQAAQAASAAAGLAGTAAAFGLDDPALGQAPLGERVDLALRLQDPRFQALARLIGRLRGLARTQHRAALRHAPEEIHRLTQGDDLSRSLPAELLGLRHPTRRLDVARRYLEHQLIQYDLTPRPRAERGPLVVCLDASGSMAGDRMDWAAAVGLALLDVARRQHRSFAACYFNHAVQATFDWPQGRVTPAEMLAFATVAADGGTDFSPAIAWALAQCDRTPYAAADLVLITDGAGDLDPDIRARWDAVRHRAGLRGFGILIQAAPSPAVEALTDRCWAVAGPDDAAAAALFAEITR